MVSTGPHGCLCSSRVVRLHWTWQSSKTGKTEARSLSSPLEKKKKTVVLDMQNSSFPS